MKSTSLEKKNYNAIDIAKFVGAIMVVAIHVEPIAIDTGSQIAFYLNFGIQHYLARLAVPFFFVTSGFLLYGKTTPEEFNLNISKQYIKRLLRLYLTWTIIYFPLVLPGIKSDEKGLVHGFSNYLKNCVVTGSITHLWFFPALIFAVGLVSFLLSKKVQPKTILIISFVFYFFGLFAQSWYGFIEPLRNDAPVVWNQLKLLQSIIETTRDGLFEAFFFVSMGMKLSFSGIRLNPHRSVALFGLSMVAFFFEAFTLQRNGFIREYDMYLFLAPAVFFLFCFLAQADLPDRPIYKELRLLSALIYYTHLGALYLGPRYINITNSSVQWLNTSFVLTLVLTLIISCSVLLLSKHRAFNWLEFLYR